MGNTIRTIGILGAGQMGMGIAQVAAQAGFSVLLTDISREAAEKGRSRMSVQLHKLIQKGKMTDEELGRVMDNIKTVDSVDQFSEVQLAIEAASEMAELKFQVFKRLDEVCPQEALLASNTSSLSITRIAAHTKRPDRVVGMHFMNPVPLMKLVEGIRGLQTSDATFLQMRQCAEKMGKTVVEVRDLPGFAVNRILIPMINEAISALSEGVASAEDIDAAMKIGTNQPMGPLALADLIGLDTCLSIMSVLHEGFGDSKYRASPLLKQYVAAGWLGRKTGRGFFKYEL